MGTWNRRFNLGGLRFSAFDQISITIKPHRQCTDREANEAVEANWGINHHPPPPAPGFPPTEHSKKKPTCGPNFSLLSGFDPSYNISKIAIHTNRII
ncbi:hypothetical protein N7465_001809 [Penicillium sp. CMV-2018d]|nr:hypothetical protein N7465_001809 [Penicillium sp. CMV-2018d]